MAKKPKRSDKYRKQLKIIGTSVLEGIAYKRQTVLLKVVLEILDLLPEKKEKTDGEDR